MCFPVVCMFCVCVLCVSRRASWRIVGGLSIDAWYKEWRGGCVLDDRMPSPYRVGFRSLLYVA